MTGLPSRMPVAIRWGQSRKRQYKRERQRQRKQLRLLRSSVQKNSPSHADCRAAARRQVHKCTYVWQPGMSELTNHILALLESHNKIKPYLIGMVRALRMTATRIRRLRSEKIECPAQ